MSADDVQTIFDQLVSERGGAGRLATSDLAVVRAVARLLAGDDLDARGAQAAASLTALLPPPLPRKPEIAPVAPVEGGQPDLSKLSDAQLHELDVLMSIACSAAPPSPDATLSDRHMHAVALAATIDDAEARGEIGRDLTPVAGIDVAFRDNLRGLIEAVLRPVLPLQLLNAGDLGLADLEVRLAAAERRAVAAEAQAEAAAKALETVGKSGHGNSVVPLRVRPSPV